MSRMEGKVAVVTGAAGEIGLAAAELRARERALVEVVAGIEGVMGTARGWRGWTSRTRRPPRR